ncbi:MAG: hypothetical protein K9M36_03595, partial [Candidatus Pacebacteria bacterium]|nr:hypothetical protein [Candidatus Paceibacterota bacterium]
MKKFAIFIIIGSLLSGFFLPGILGVPSINNNIAFAQDPNGPPPPPGSTTDGDGNTVVPENDPTGNNSGNTNSSSGSPIEEPEADDAFGCYFKFKPANFINCVGLLLYIPYYITQVIAGVSATFLDVMIDYSTQSASYESGFVSEGWKIIRDLTNIGFIFALLYIAISTIVGQGSAKSTLVWVIIMALIVNFSFFATRVVIDASNILARVFYQNVNIQDDNTDPSQTTTTKSITKALVDKVKVQNIKNDVNTALQEQEGGEAMSDYKIALIGILLTVLVTIVNIVMIFVFFSIAMLFVGRVVGLWFSIIASPLAFLSVAFPGGKSWRRVGWTAWSDDLFKTAFLAPVFLFFIYLIILFLNTGFLDGAMSGGSTLLSVLVGIIVPFAFFMTLLMTAKKLSSEMAGQIASSVTGALNTAMMVAGGGAMAGAALAGGAVGAGLGKVGTSVGSRLLAKNATSTTGWGKAGRFAGSSLNSAGKGMKNVNWDPRNNMLGKGLNKVGSLTGAGTMPTFGQGFSAKYGSGQGISDIKTNLNENWKKKKQARADELADAVAEHGKVPGSDKTYKQNLDTAKDNHDEFMSRFGHVLESLDQKIKEESGNLRTANQALQAAERTGDDDLIKRAKEEQEKAIVDYNSAKDAKGTFIKGGTATVDGVDYNGQILDDKGNPKSLEQLKTTMNTAQAEQTKATTGARNFYAEEIKNPSKFEVVIDTISSGGGSIGQRKQASRDVRNKAK